MNQYYIKRYIDSAVKREVRHYRMHQDGMLDSLKAKLKEQANKLKETINKFRNLPARDKAAKIVARLLQIVSLIIGANSVKNLYLDVKEFKEKLKFFKMFINSEYGSDRMKAGAVGAKEDFIFKQSLWTILDSFTLILSLFDTYIIQKASKSI